MTFPCRKDAGEKMSKKTKAFLSVIVIAVLCCGIAVSGQAAGLFDFFGSKNDGETVTISKTEYEQLKKFEKLNTVLQYIEQYYYQEPDEDAMIEMATRGLLAGLDDIYTFYYSPEEWKEMWADDDGEYAGIGIQLLGNYQDNTVFITRVFKNTPAEKAGLLRGDELIRVEDIAVDATTMQNAVNVMRGEENAPVEVEVRRGEESLVFSIPRAMIHVNRVEYTMLKNNVGYIALYEFAGDCAQAFENAMKELTDQGAEALVVDLRDNSGGWVDDAKNIGDLFLDRQLMFYSEDRYGNREENWTKDGKTDLPLVMLINEYSASSSEILAGSLQDAGRATLVGTTSYGKGIMQYVLPLEDIGSGEDGFQFTVAQYYMPSGKVVHKVGIEPDVKVEMPEGMQSTYFQVGDLSDPQLAAAWEEALKKIPAEAAGR